MPTDSAVDAAPHQSDTDLAADELFQIIDESGAGFGFDLTPHVLAKPLAIGTAALFSLGMLAGIPFGLAMGRSDETGSNSPKSRASAVRPSLDGVKFAASTFGLGTLLCATAGITSFYAVKHYYAVETFEQFGAVMRRDVPQRRTQIEQRLSPALDALRNTATDNLPQPVQNLRDHFARTRFGRWLKSNIDLSATVSNDQHYNDSDNDNDSDIAPTQSNSPPL